MELKMENKPKRYVSVSVDLISQRNDKDSRDAWLNCTVNNGIAENIRFRASIEEKTYIARQLITLGNKLLASNRGEYD